MLMKELEQAEVAEGERCVLGHLSEGRCEGTGRLTVE